MTYEEKLNITVEAINEARQFTSKEYFTKLRLGTGNGLSRIDLGQLHDILLQLEQDEKIIKIEDTPTALKSLTNKTSDIMNAGGNKNYFLIDVLESFNQWYDTFLLKKKTSLSGMDFITMLRIYDLVLDINEQIQLTNQTEVYFDLIPPLIRYQILFPKDTPSFRDQYCQNRIGSLKHLKSKGVITDYSHGRDGWDTRVSVELVLSDFENYYRKIKDEYIKRNKNSNSSKNKKDKPQKTTNTKTVSYNPSNGILTIEKQEVKLRKDSFRAKMIELLLKDDKTIKKEWSWDEIVEAIEGIEDANMLKQYKKKFYPACDGLSKHLASKTGINDLLIFNKTTVRINPEYTTPSQ